MPMHSSGRHEVLCTRAPFAKREESILSLMPLSRLQDLFFSFISLYNTLMKIFFISATATIVLWMVTKYKSSYDADSDKFHGDGSFLVRV
jgi:ER lumen protein retaining receptor